MARLMNIALIIDGIKRYKRGNSITDKLQGEQIIMDRLCIPDIISAMSKPGETGS
jgi:hypothetical protein